MYLFNASYNKTLDYETILETIPEIPNRVIKNYLTPFMSIVSIIVIVITLFIIHKRNLWISTRIYLTALGLVDILGLTILTIASMDYFVLNYINMPNFYRISQYLFVLFEAVLLLSNWLTTILGIERYFVISYPFLTKQITNSHRKLVTIFCFTGIILVKIPSLILLINNESIVNNEFQQQNQEIQNNLYNFELWQSWIVDFFLFLIVPFCVLIFVNTRLILTIRRSSRFMRQYCTSRKRKIENEERKITCIMICVIMAFFICQGPFVTYTALSNVHLLQSHFKNSQSMLQSVSILVLSMKSDFSFVLHCWVCDKFGAALKRMFCNVNIPREQNTVSYSMHIAT